MKRGHKDVELVAHDLLRYVSDSREDRWRPAVAQNEIFTVYDKTPDSGPSFLVTSVTYQAT